MSCISPSQSSSDGRQKGGHSPGLAPSEVGMGWERKQKFQGFEAKQPNSKSVSVTQGRLKKEVCPVPWGV